MISSDGNQNNICFYSCSLPIAILSGFRVAAIGLPTLEYTLFEKPQGGGKLTPPLAVRFSGLKEVWGGSKVASTKRLLSCLAHFGC